MNRFKFNSGAGALVCNDCDRIIEAPFTEKDFTVFAKYRICPHCKNIRNDSTHNKNISET